MAIPERDYRSQLGVFLVGNPYDAWIARIPA